MSTVLIVVIVVVVVLVIALLLVLPRLRARARVRGRGRELDQRRERVVEEHHQEAAGRERSAEIAEQRARVAEQEAQRDRAEARVEQEKARLHEKGLADHELIGQDERQEFAGTSAVDGGDPSNRRESTVPDVAAGEGPQTGAVRNEPLVSEREHADAPEGARAASDEPQRVEDLRAARRQEKDR